MSDPPRLKLIQGSPEALLLASARTVEPPSSAEEEIWRRLETITTVGAAAGTAALLSLRPAATGAKLAGKGLWLAVLKWGAIVAVGAPAVGVAVHESLPVILRAVHIVAPTRPAADKPPIMPAVDSKPAPEAAQIAAPDHLDVVDPSTSRPVHPVGKSLTGLSALTKESDQLAAARAKLARGDPRGALADIARLSSEFPHGRLRQEREVVAIDCLMALGERDAARARSRTLLREFPSSPYAAHLSRVLEQ
jgi:hypothetical protein